MTIGFCKDYIDEYMENNDPKRKNNKSRKASQEDFDAF